MQIESKKKKLCLEPLRGIITQGEKMADTVTFRLPATYGALVLSDLSWQIRAASEKNTLVTADLTASSGGEFCLVQWEVSADFTAVSGALSLMLVGTDSEGNVVIKFPGDDPIWIRDSETGEYAPPPDALEQAVIGIQQAQAALESAQESLEDAAQALQNATANFRILGHYDSLPELQSAITNPSVGDAYGVGDPTVVYVWNGSAWTQLPGVLVSPSLPMSVANGGTGGTTVTQALANLGAQASNNLLVNPRFKYNSRSQQSYSTTGNDFTVDGWMVQGNQNQATVAVSENGIVFTPSAGNQGVYQLLKEPLEVGKTYTISVVVNGAVYSATQKWEGTGVYPPYPGQGFNFGFDISGGQYRAWVYLDYRTQSSSVTITAAKLELGSVSTLQAELDNPPPEDVEKLKLDMYDLDPGRCAYLPWHNENLLDNWYFVGGGSQQGGGQFPINQRGQASYTGGVYGIDCWRSNRSTTTVTVESNGIHFSDSNTSDGGIRQSIETDLQEKTVTLSLLVSELSGSVTIWARSDVSFANYGRKSISSPGLVTVTATIPSGYSGNICFYVDGYGSPSSQVSATILAAKLELGYLSTLARKDEEGNWILNDAPPNFQQELAKCQRYLTLIDKSFTMVGTGMGSLTLCPISVPLPVPMRANPTTVINGSIWVNTVKALLGNSIQISNPTISNSTLGNYNTVLNLTIQNGGSIPNDEFYFVQIRDGTSQIIISAEL